MKKTSKMGKATVSITQGCNMHLVVVHDPCLSLAHGA